MKKVSIVVLLVLNLFTIPLLALAQSEEPTIYIIKKGDTLWGLSDRFLKDPYYWPNLWARNQQQITNPHIIFPGQKVRVYPDRIEVEPLPAAAGAAPARTAVPPAEEPAALERAFTVSGAEGFLLEKALKPSGFIITTNQNRHIVGEDDIVYVDIGKENGGKVGDRFSIFKKMDSISHPVTNIILGEKVIPLGTLQLTEVEQKASRAIITKSYQEIGPGSYLLPYKERRREVVLKDADRDVSGYIVESQTGNQAVGASDVVFMDLGKSQGVEPGNLLYILRDVVPDQQYADYSVKKLPAELLGAVVVVDVAANTSTGLIVKSIDTIYRGDRVELKKSR